MKPSQDWFDRYSWAVPLLLLVFAVLVVSLLAVLSP